jgi:flagellar biosynthesis component FlhA
VGPDHQKLDNDLVPGVLPLSTVQRVLQGLLIEQV